MIDQGNAISFPSISSGGGSPLEKVLMARHFTPHVGMPSMNMSFKKPKMGMHENQPKLKPLAHGFHNPKL